MPQPEPDLERVEKYCPDPGHIGVRDFKGWMWKKEAPTAGLSRAPQDEEGRYVQLCDACVDRWQEKVRRRQRINRESDESPELTPPKRTGEDEDDGTPF